MSGKDVLKKLNVFGSVSNAIEAKVLEGLAEKARVATAAALSEVPMLDAVLDGEPMIVAVGPITIPAFHVPIQLRRG